MGLIFVVLGVIAMTILLRSLSFGRPVQLLVVSALLIVPPLAMQAALGMR